MARINYEKKEESPPKSRKQRYRCDGDNQTMHDLFSLLKSQSILHNLEQRFNQSQQNTN
jgi:hypothetical protein